MTPRVTWTPPGRQTESTLSSTRADWGAWSLFMRASDGSGVDVPLVKSEDSDRYTVASWSRANVLVFNVFNDKNRR